jgi:branched-chain amino acid transport system substrate-binding protein
VGPGRAEGLLQARAQDQIRVNNYGVDERTPALAGEAAEGVIGIQDVAYWGDNVPGMKTLMEFHQKHHPNDTHNSPYMRGWLWVIVAAEAIKWAGPNPTGETVKKALESLLDFDTWGLTPPFTYTNEDHRPTTRARFVVIKGGKLLPMREVSVERDMKWIGN